MLLLPDITGTQKESLQSLVLYGLCSDFYAAHVS